MESKIKLLDQMRKTSLLVHHHAGQSLASWARVLVLPQRA